jgi:hypothetical protein
MQGAQGILNQTVFKRHSNQTSAWSSNFLLPRVIVSFTRSNLHKSLSDKTTEASNVMSWTCDLIMQASKMSLGWDPRINLLLLELHDYPQAEYTLNVLLIKRSFLFLTHFTVEGLAPLRLFPVIRASPVRFPTERPIPNSQ